MEVTDGVAIATIAGLPMETSLKIPEVGRYRILRPLGRGAMGTVYLADDPVIGRRIALKVLKLDMPGAEGSADRLRSRFQTEVKSAGILSHPHIVTVYDAIEETNDGGLCIAMEYVEGTTLSDILRRPEPIGTDVALDLGAQIADALAYAHGKGVIHRDIKPANVIVTPSGQTKITDFGIAHLIDVALSDDLRFLGTPSYMAPERIEGREIDERADLFSLGVVLYQLVTRHMPFQGSSVADLTRSIARDEPTPPERYVPELRPDFRSILARCLEKSPRKRYQDAATLAADLRGVLTTLAAQHSTQPVPPQTGAAPGRWSGRLASAGAKINSGSLGRKVAMVAAVVALAAAGLFWWRARPAATREPPPAAAATGLPAPYVAALNQGMRRLASGETEEAIDLLRSAELLGPGSRRANLWRELAEDRLERDRLARTEIEILDLVDTGRAELSAGRFRSARRQLAQAKALDPEHLAVADLGSRLWLAEQRRQEHQANAAEPPVETPPPPIEIEPQVVEVAPAPVPTTGALELDFFSQRSRGVLTIYEDDRQIYRQGFRFTERRRFLPPKAATGSLSANFEMPVGEIELRLYLSLPGHETQVIPVRGEIAGGGRTVLRLRVSADGEFTAYFR